MAADTKERILNAALKMFSEKGFKGTNIRELLAEIGLSKAAFYKHYESKEELWNALIDRMEEYYYQRFVSADNLLDIPKSGDEFLSLTKRLVDFTIHDEKIIMTRKLLLIEQFRDERIKKLATEHFVNGTMELYKKIFKQMIERGILKNEDPEVIAFAFTAPITSLIHYCDREPEKEPVITKHIEAFVRHFLKMYSKE